MSTYVGMFNLLQLLPVGCGYVVSALGLRWSMRFSMDSSIMVVTSCGVILVLCHCGSCGECRITE